MNYEGGGEKADTSYERADYLDHQAFRKGLRRDTKPAETWAKVPQGTSASEDGVAATISDRVGGIPGM